jgi:hypothetical protein
MADKTPSKEASSSLSDTVATTSPESTPEDQQITELRELTRSLMGSVQAMQVQSARNAVFQDAIADVKSATRAMLVAPAVAGPIAYPNPDLTRECGEQPCSCVSSQCCCFDIKMEYVRVLAMQPLELQDSNANPWGEMEVQMFASLDGGIGAVIPSMFQTLQLRKHIQHAGLKVGVNRTIGTVCLPKSGTKSVRINCDSIEADSGLIERATGGRDEEGSNFGTMILDCCCNVQPTLSFDIAFTSGGQGGGAIEVGFIAVRAC